MKRFELLRNSIISEAKASPNLLSDLAGLERYISETYDSRSFVELIQNAEDASSTRFRVIGVNEDIAIVSNNGRYFNLEDIDSLCRSAASKKSRGTAIGYRGIGFKSVVNLCSRVHLISGDYEITFCRTLSSREVPEAEVVPLIRIPHDLDEHIKLLTKDIIDNEKNNGMKSFFIFEGVDSRAIQDELSDLDSTSLLFLKNLEEIEIHAHIEKNIYVNKNYHSDGSVVTLTSDQGQEDYFLFDGEQGRFSLAIRLIDGMPMWNMSAKDAVVHAFLPSFEPSGINSKIQGDISTDPSRTRVVLDERTNEIISNVSKFIVNKLSHIIDLISSGKELGDNEKIFFAAIVPTNDPRSKIFQKSSFSARLYEKIKEISGEKFSDVHVRPSWINPADYYVIIKASKAKFLIEDFAYANNSKYLTKHLGFYETDISFLLSNLNKTKIDLLGCSQVISKALSLHTIGHLDDSIIDRESKLWFSEGASKSYNDLAEKNLKLDQDLVDLIIEKFPNRKIISSFLDKYLGVDNRIKDQFVNDEIKQSLIVNKKTIDAKSTDLRPLSNQSSPNEDVGRLEILTDKSIRSKWRTAEEIFAYIFTKEGWNVEDVSKKNIGYDYYCSNATGEELFVEVKKIKNESEGFILTSNEEAVARVKGDKYAIALIRDADGVIEISMLYEPLKSMKLTRQCRQWVWFCESFPYNPVSFKKD